MTNCGRLSSASARLSSASARLNRRAVAIAQQLEQNPNVSIPAAFKTKAEMEACYRFCNNVKVTPDKILQPRVEATYERVAETDFALFVQDTSEIDLTRPQQQVQGAGPMDSESRRGAFFHPVIAFTFDAVALGIVGHKTYTRDSLRTASPSKKTETRRQTPIENKESGRFRRICG